MFGQNYAFDENISDEEILARNKVDKDKEKKQPQRINYELMKNPETKKAVMQEAFKAAKIALEAGGSMDDDHVAAENAMMK